MNSKFIFLLFAVFLILPLSFSSMVQLDMSFFNKSSNLSYYECINSVCSSSSYSFVDYLGNEYPHQKVHLLANNTFILTTEKPLAFGGLYLKLKSQYSTSTHLFPIIESSYYVSPKYNAIYGTVNKYSQSYEQYAGSENLSPPTFTYNYTLSFPDYGCTHYSYYSFCFILEPQDYIVGVGPTGSTEIIDTLIYDNNILKFGQPYFAMPKTMAGFVNSKMAWAWTVSKPSVGSNANYTVSLPYLDFRGYTSGVYNLGGEVKYGYNLEKKKTINNFTLTVLEPNLTVNGVDVTGNTITLDDATPITLGIDDVYVGADSDMNFYYNFVGGSYGEKKLINTSSSVFSEITPVTADLWIGVRNSQTGEYLWKKGYFVYVAPPVVDPIYGCKDENANNYDPDATATDNDLCTYDVIIPPPTTDGFLGLSITFDKFLTVTANEEKEVVLVLKNMGAEAIDFNSQDFTTSLVKMTEQISGAISGPYTDFDNSSFSDFNLAVGAEKEIYYVLDTKDFSTTYLGSYVLSAKVKNATDAFAFTLVSKSRVFTPGISIYAILFLIVSIGFIMSAKIKK